MFAETYDGAFQNGVRVFNVYINGKLRKGNVDVFKAVGANKPLFFKFGNVIPVKGVVTITIARITGKENPMLSGVIIYGANADKLVKGGFMSNTATATTTAPLTTTSVTPSCSKGIFGLNKSKGQMACCPDECGKCGGKGCSKFSPGKLCCISGVFKTQKSCDTYPPPCVPSANTASTPSITKPQVTAVVPVSPNTPPSSCPVSGATAKAFRLNVAGGSFTSAEMAADNLDYVEGSNKGQVFSSSSMIISAKSGPEPWDSAFSSHRWTYASSLTYKIPVRAGSFTVKLLFSEIYFTKPDERAFDVVINGVTKENKLDVFKVAGHKVGLVRPYKNIQSKGGYITVSLVKSVENPMLSGIFIEGPGAGQNAVGGGCTSAVAKTDAGESNSGYDHRAHSVPGGPYIATDFDKNGQAFVHFDGTQSHSHYSDPGPPEVTGSIVKYKWTWTETVNGKKVNKMNTDSSGKFTAPFSLGKTTVTLEVVDNTGDTAIDTAIVEVKSSTENGAYCYFYDYGKSTFAKVPLKSSLDSVPKPQHGEPHATINFNNLADFGKLPFSSNSFAVRCMFFINIQKNGHYSYNVKHNGPFRLYHSGLVLSESGSKGTTKSKLKYMKAGLNSFQLQYFRPKNLSPVLALSGSKGILSTTALQHDSSATLPVINSMSKTSSAPAGGQNIQIFGTGFINGVSVQFGTVEATNLISSDPGTLQITVPPGSGDVLVTVTTNAGVSNALTFSYTSGETLEQPVIFKKVMLKGSNGGDYKASFISTATYGPDGRLYLGTFKSGKMYGLGVDRNFKVVSTCERKIDSDRSILGVAFSPFTNDLKMYFTSNSLYWKDKNYYDFEDGWANGKVEVIEFSKTILEDSNGKSCAGSPSDVITGLPVSNHDHGTSKLQFMPDGSLLISVGGFSNGGISVPGKKPVKGDAPDDLLGGVASNPLSAAIVSCPVNKVTNIKYDQYHDPEKSKVVSGTACKVYASGFRNCFGMTLHSNGNLYATDNGPNAGFGEFSTNCDGGKTAAKNIPDKLFLVEKGKYHGHPNLNRKECVHYPSWAVQPIVGNLKSSSNGVIEYRSNTFGGEIKGNMFVTMFAGQHAGQIAQVRLEGEGGKKSVGFAPNFLDFSGLSVVEGPRGEFVMPRVYQGHVVVAAPQYPEPSVTLMIGVHPKQGPSTGGSKVLISGHKFGFTPKATFGGKACTDVAVIDDNAFTCKTPAMGKNQKVSVVVTGLSGSSPSYGTDYWYF